VINRSGGNIVFVPYGVEFASHNSSPLSEGFRTWGQRFSLLSEVQRLRAAASGKCKGYFLRTWCGLYISICALHRWRLLRDYPNRFFEYGIFVKVPMLVGDDANEGTGFVTKTLSKWIQRTSRLRNACNLLPWIRWCGIREQILLRDLQCKHFTCYYGLLDQLCPVSESGSTLPSWQLLDHVLHKKQIVLQTSRTRMGSVPFKDLAKCQF
jgi:hypothetical protein